MPRPKKVIVKKDPKEIRAEVRDYIKNERDTVLKKWMALEEQLFSEDTRKAQFIERRLKYETHTIPMNIQKFIGTLKRSVRKTIRDKGGTPFSIIRNMFIYWDADKSGEISAVELKACMHSLGVKMTDQQIDEVVLYYNSIGNDGKSGANSTGNVEMNYDELLKDILEGEPSLIQFMEKKDMDKLEDVGLRYEEITDDYVEMPPDVVDFIEASRDYIATKMRNVGGTPFEHIRNVFQKNDFNYSNGLSAELLVHAAKSTMKLEMTISQAHVIVKYYDKRQVGQMNYTEFLKDVCKGVKSILTFTELSPRGILERRRSLARNPFIPKSFQVKPNKQLEKFKKQIKNILFNKIRAMGGTMNSWLKGAFLDYDVQGTGKIRDPEGVRIVCKKLDYDISYEEAMSLIDSYDRDGDGSMVYAELMKDISSEDPQFMADPKQLMIDLASTATSRTPPTLVKIIDKYNKAVMAYAWKSKGGVQPRDVLHGSFLKYDYNSCGRVTREDFNRVSADLGIRLRDSEVDLMVQWFDTDATQTVDYNEFTRQLFGEDIQTRALSLPQLSKKAAKLLAGKVEKGTFGPGITNLSNRSLESLLATHNSSHSLSGSVRPMTTDDTNYGVSSSGLSSNQSTNITRPCSSSPKTNFNFGEKNPGFVFTAAAWKSHARNSMVEGLRARDKIVQVVENKSIKEARRLVKRDMILAERNKVHDKLESIEQQRLNLVAEYKQRQAAMKQQIRG